MKKVEKKKEFYSPVVATAGRLGRDNKKINSKHLFCNIRIILSGFIQCAAYIVNFPKDLFKYMSQYDSNGMLIGIVHNLKWLFPIEYTYNRISN